MTITYNDSFAFLPKRCDICNRLFVFEMYNYFYVEVGIDRHSQKWIKCKRCIRGGKESGEE